MNFKVEPEFENYLPHRSPERQEMLEKQIIADGGVREPFVVWAGENILIDGHGRFKICLNNNLPYPEPVKMEFDNEDDAKLWMIMNQASRRNWSEEEETLMMGKAYELQKKQQGGDRKGENIKCADSHLISTAGKIGEQFGKKANQVRRAEKISKAVEKINSMKPEFKEKYLSGEHPSNEKIIKAAKIADEAPEEAERILSGATVCQQLNAIEDKMSENSGVKVCLAFFMETQSLALKAFAPRIMKTINDEGKKVVQKNFKKWMSDMEAYQDLFIKNTKEIEK